MKQSMEKVRQFLIRRLWSIDPRELSIVRRFLVRVGQVASLVVRDFFKDQCMLQASALTYTTLLSLVPLLALMFAILKGFGVQDFLEPLILERLAVGSDSIVTGIMTYIDNTNFGRLGAVGLVLLLVTALTLLVNIETAFNHIWGVPKNRTLVRCFTDYLSVVVVGPLLLFAAISITTSLRDQELVLRLLATEYLGDAVLVGFALLPFVAMWAAFTFLYIFMTNTQVRFGAALFGGIFGGTLWQLLQWIYVSSQVGVTRYNAIYGTMAALPIFMVWVYLSWLCVLLGLELSHAWQNLRTLRQEAAMGEVSYASREFVALALLLLIAADFYRGVRPRSREALAEELDLPPRLTQRALSDLVRLGFLNEVRDETQEGELYQPGREPETLRLAVVVEALREDGESCLGRLHKKELAVVARLEQVLANADRLALGELTLGGLVRQLQPAQEVER
jgi:membrane protein